MQKSDIIGFASLAQLNKFLRQVELGRVSHLAPWVLEGLQDRGLIDHRDALTDKGRAALTAGKQT